MNQPISMVRGTTQTFAVNLTASTGQSYTLADGEVVRFGVKRKPADTVCVIEKEITNENYDNGVYTFILTPDDTKKLSPGCYYYDIGLQSGDSYFIIIECSIFQIRYNITSREVVT